MDVGPLPLCKGARGGGLGRCLPGWPGGWRAAIRSLGACVTPCGANIVPAFGVRDVVGPCLTARDTLGPACLEAALGCLRRARASIGLGVRCRLWVVSCSAGRVLLARWMEWLDGGRCRSRGYLPASSAVGSVLVDLCTRALRVCDGLMAHQDDEAGGGVYR